MAKLSIGEFLSVLRKAKGFTQENVAEQLGVSAKSVSSWENNRTYPDIMMLPAIAELYGVTVDELVRGERDVKGEPTERQEETSRDSLRRIRKRKYASYHEKRMIYTSIAVASALVSVLGCILMSFVALWTMVFAILGMLGTATGIILSEINKKKYLAGEGIVLPEDITEETHPMMLTVCNNNLLSYVLSALPYCAYGAIIWLLWFFCRDEYWLSAYIQRPVRTIGGITLFLGLGLLVFALVNRIRLIRRFGNEEQQSKQKKNVKLSVILVSIAVGILIFFELIACVSALLVTGNHSNHEGELYDNFEDFKDYMHTISTEPRRWFDQNDNEVPVPSTTLHIPSEAFITQTDWWGEEYYEFIPGEYDCGNSFYIIAHDDDYNYHSGSIKIDNPVFLYYEYKDTAYRITELTDCIMMIEHPSADGTETVCDPVINIRYADYALLDEERNETNTVVMTIPAYSGSIEERVYTEIYVAEYKTGGKYAGKYGIFIYHELDTGWALTPLLAWAYSMFVYAVIATIIFAVKYKRQKIAFEL